MQNLIICFNALSLKYNWGFHYDLIVIIKAFANATHRFPIIIAQKLFVRNAKGTVIKNGLRIPIIFEKNKVLKSNPF